jgi:hypothetical protein
MPPCNTKKTLTPVMTCIVMICITIAISLATLAWIHGLPTSTMYTEELCLTSLQWGPDYTYIDITLFNNGTRNVKLGSITINSKPVTIVYIFGSSQINTKEAAIVRVSNTYVSGENYQLSFKTAKGNRFVYEANAKLIS